MHEFRNVMCFNVTFSNFETLVTLWGHNFLILTHNNFINSYWLLTLVLHMLFENDV